jgi:hypothetical protein
VFWLIKEARLTKSSLVINIKRVGWPKTEREREERGQRALT